MNCHDSLKDVDQTSCSLGHRGRDNLRLSSNKLKFPPKISFKQLHEADTILFELFLENFLTLNHNFSFDAPS